MSFFRHVVRPRSAGAADRERRRRACVAEGAGPGVRGKASARGEKAGGSVRERVHALRWRPVILRDVSFELAPGSRSEEHTSELQSLMRISYAVFCLKKNNTTPNQNSS